MFKWQYVKDVSVAGGAIAHGDYIVFPALASCPSLKSSCYQLHQCYIKLDSGWYRINMGCYLGAAGFNPNNAEP